MKGYIYQITNKKNQKLYIGSTTKKVPRHRWNQHKYDARIGSGYRLHAAIRKYGANNFDFSIIYETTNINELDSIEQWYIDKFEAISKNGYNAIGVVNGSRKLITKSMIKEWKNSKKRKARLKAMREGTRHRFKSIVGINIENKQIVRFENIRDAGRAGFHIDSIYMCFKNKAKTSQRHCWFYNKGQSDKQIENDALKLIGKFKIERYKAFYGKCNKTAKIISFSNSKELNVTKFKWKGVYRSIKEGRSYLGYKWFFK